MALKISNINVRFCFFGLFLVTFFQSTTYFAFGQNKHAIVVAIGNYPQNNKGEVVWKNLNSLNDVDLIRGMLEDQRFPNANCYYLLDENATPENLNKTFDKLFAKLQTGDVVFFHYSGHGQQVADITPKKRKDLIGGDEADGLDEALVLYNAPKNFKAIKDYEMEHHYVDDQLNIQFTRIRKKIGQTGQLVVTIDACHSGTATRGSQLPLVRGTSEICAPDGWMEKSKTFANPSFALDFEDNNSDYGTLAAFFGCKPEQVNSEFLPQGSNMMYGSLTYFFIHGMRSLEENASYANLFMEIRKQMLFHFRGNQIPEFEGNNPEQKLFSNQFIPIKPYFLVNQIFSNEVNINAGLISGLSLGDEIGLYESDVNNPIDVKPLYSGKIIKISAQDAIVRTDIPISDQASNPGAYRVFLMKRSVKGSELRVKLELKKHKKEIERRINEIGTIIPSKIDYKYHVKEQKDGKVIIYSDVDELVPLREMNPMTLVSSEQFDSIVGFLVEAAKVERLRTMVLDDPAISFEIDFSGSALSKVIERETYQMTATNTGSKNIHIQIVEIEPNMKINVYPDFKFFLTPGSKKIINLEFVADPPGMAQYLFFATSESVDLSPLAELGTTIKTRGNNTELMEYLQPKSNSRSAGSGPNKVTLKSLILEINKKP
jgi:hypothetical protein